MAQSEMRVNGEAWSPVYLRWSGLRLLAVVAPGGCGATN